MLIYLLIILLFVFHVFYRGTSYPYPLVATLRCKDLPVIPELGFCVVYSTIRALRIASVILFAHKFWLHNDSSKWKMLVVLCMVCQTVHQINEFSFNLGTLGRYNRFTTNSIWSCPLIYAAFEILWNIFLFLILETDCFHKIIFLTGDIQKLLSGFRISRQI